MGVRNNYEFKVGNKKRSDNRKLWKMPGTYLMTLDECPVRHLTTLQRWRHCYKKLKLGVQFYFKTPQFSINKQSVPKEMYAHLQPPKKDALSS